MHRDENTQRMYLHHVGLLKNLSQPLISTAPRENTSRKHSGSLTSSDIHNILHGYLSDKPNQKAKTDPATNQINWSNQENAQRRAYFDTDHYEMVTMSIDEILNDQDSHFKIDANNPKNRIANRVEQAKQRFIDGEPMDRPVIERGDDGKLHIVDGRHRIAALKELGFSEVSVFQPKENIQDVGDVDTSESTKNYSRKTPLKPDEERTGTSPMDTTFKTAIGRECYSTCLFDSSTSQIVRYTRCVGEWAYRCR